MVKTYPPTHTHTHTITTQPLIHISEVVVIPRLQMVMSCLAPCTGPFSVRGTFISSLLYSTFERPRWERGGMGLTGHNVCMKGRIVSFWWDVSLSPYCGLGARLSVHCALGGKALSEAGFGSNNPDSFCDFSLLSLRALFKKIKMTSWPVDKGLSWPGLCWCLMLM